jgi:drug/metabolite transporter (DMT)-like permease
MNSKSIGYLCGIIAAVTYGLNPLGALNLYAGGINVDSVLFYRYGLATVLLAGIILLKEKSFKIGRRECKICLLLGLLFAASSLTFFTSFHYMDAGMACTILFVYPVMVAVIMAVFFKERMTLVAALSIGMALTGMGLLYKGEDGAVLSAMGVLLVMAASLAYALYIVTVYKFDLSLHPLMLTFCVMLVGTLIIVLHSFTRPDYHLRLLGSAPQWGWAVMLAVVPTIISLMSMVVAVKRIGSTPTAIMGALEPVTAVVIGVTVFGESFTARIALGMSLILLAVLMIITGRPLMEWLKRRRF